jgi:hypothetical protein
MKKMRALIDGASYKPSTKSGHISDVEFEPQPPMLVMKNKNGLGAVVLVTAYRFRAQKVFFVPVCRDAFLDCFQHVASIAYLHNMTYVCVLDFLQQDDEPPNDQDELDALNDAVRL